jgi:hypothetical protein
MPREPEKLSDVIWNGEFGFVCEDRYRDVVFEPCFRAARENFERYLLQSNRLPELGGAPVASWLLARLARLAGHRFPFSFGQVVGSDGAEYSLRFFCFSKPKTPIGVLACVGSAEGIHLSLGLLKAEDGEAILDAFVEALLQEPCNVARCRLVVQYTEMTDPKVAFHLPKVYGWDGRHYLNEVAPEHAVDPSEYE